MISQKWLDYRVAKDPELFWCNKYDKEVCKQKDDKFKCWLKNEGCGLCPFLYKISNEVERR